MCCPNCGYDSVSTIGPYIGKHPLFSNLSLAHCVHCDLVFAHPQPSHEDLSDYYSHYWDGKVAVSTPSTRRYFLSQSLSRADYLQHFDIFKKKPAVLDVGAGLGLFHEGLMRRGVSHEYAAVETDFRQYHSLIKRFGTNTVFRSLEDIPPGRTFDLLVLAHVLEHIGNPNFFVETIVRLLRPGGLLFVEVPHRDYRYKALFESHLLFFNQASLENCLRRHGKVLDVSTVGEESDKLYIQHVHPKPDILRPLKELVKTCIAVATPNYEEKQIKRYGMSKYGGDRQWLRAVVAKAPP